MTNHRSRGGTESSPYPSDFYDCSTYTLAHQKRTNACCGHYIRTKAVRELVLNTIRTVSAFAISNQEEFAEKVRAASQIKQKEAAKETKRRLSKDKKRIAELDNIIKKLYESFAIGHITDERFDTLLAEYEAEQKTLQATVRSARRMRLLRKPYGQCHSSAALLSLSTQSAICFASSSKQLFPFWKQLAACLRKSATGSFIAVTGIASPATPIFFFAKKKQKRERGRKDGENEWRSTTWKPKWSAEVRDGLRLPLPLI